MFFPSPAILLSLTVPVFAQDTNLLTIEKAFTDANIPANLSLSFNPKVLLEVTFPETNGRDITLQAGVQLPVDATAGPPIFSIIGDAGPGPFVVATVDPDAPFPQHPTSAQYRHFLGGNFFPESPDRLEIPLRTTTPAISNFLQPAPPAGSDPHRYVFLLFNQPNNFNDQMLITPATSRSSFNISQFASEVGLGEPIGGTFMRVGPDPSSA